MRGKNTQTVQKMRTNLQNLVDGLIDKNYEQGVQLAVNWEGEPVVDIAAGRMFPDRDTPVESDTLFPTCSTSKGLAATLLHVLAARGQLDYDSPVANYWPDYGRRGKESTTVREALSHRAGVPDLPNFDTPEEIDDWPAAAIKLADLEPIHPPGERTSYHAWTWGWLAGMIAEGAGGRPFGAMFRDYIARPLGFEKNMYFGVDDDAVPRIAPYAPQPAAKDEQTPADREVHAAAARAAVPGPLPDFMNRPGAWRAGLPSVGCLTSAAAVARFYTAVIGDAALPDGSRLLPAAILDEATRDNVKPDETPVGFSCGMGLGYTLKGPAGNRGAFFGHGGSGGSEGMVIRPLRLALGLTKNRFETHPDAPDHTRVLVVNTIFDIVGRDYDGGFYPLSQCARP